MIYLSMTKNIYGINKIFIEEVWDIWKKFLL